MNESDPRSDVHYLGSSENQACTGFEPMTSAIPVQRCMFCNTACSVTLHVL